jgi:adenosylmethionine-8-amino-7-oxononanoate aminotransferase
VFFCNSGAEANENAIGLARKVTGRIDVVSVAGGWHGRTAATLGVTDGAKYEEIDFSCVFDAESFSFGTAKLPARIAEPGEEQFRERVAMLERFDAMWSALYQEFLRLRLSTAWEKALVPAVKAWASGAPTLTTAAYRGLLRRA